MSQTARPPDCSPATIPLSAQLMFKIIGRSHHCPSSAAHPDDRHAPNVHTHAHHTLYRRSSILHSPNSPRDVVTKYTKLDTIRKLNISQFFFDRPLTKATLKPSTIKKYSEAFHRFQFYLQSTQTSLTCLDTVFEEYVHLIFSVDERACARQEMSNLLCMILIIFPEYRQRVGRTTRALKGWKQLKPSRSATPFTREMVFAFACLFLRSNKTEAAAVLLLSFGAYLRISEAINLEWTHIALPGDSRLSGFPAGTAGANIKDAKTSKQTGRLQFVTIDDPPVVRFLQMYRAANSAALKFAPHANYATYSAALKEATNHFGLSNISIRPHSARIGKALEDYVQGKSVEQIAINGRWSALNSLRYYLNNGNAWVLDMHLSPESQSCLTAYANQLLTLL